MPLNLFVSAAGLVSGPAVERGGGFAVAGGVPVAGGIFDNVADSAPRDFAAFVDEAQGVEDVGLGLFALFERGR